MALSTSSPLYATATYTAARSPCASPATSTDSLHDDPRAGNVLSPSKLPGLQFAISHRRRDLRLPLPLLANGRNYDAENKEMTHTHPPHHHALYLSMPQCETPHYLPGVPMCPETSPLDKKSCAAMLVDPDHLDINTKTRKKGTRRGTLNAEAKNVLKAWMFSPEHFAHPYPSEDEKEELALEAGIEVKQLSNWFTNARKRLWQPVLRQSGVEVKNFLSTGRGGPRGNKLDVPVNLQHLIAQKEAEDDDDASPPSSPSGSSDNARGAMSLKRAWCDMASSPESSAVAKKKSAIQKRCHPSKRKEDDDALNLSVELRHELASHMARPVSESTVNKFKDIEIQAAASLIGLHLQPVYQPVH